MGKAGLSTRHGNIIQSNGQQQYIVLDWLSATPYALQDFKVLYKCCIIIIIIIGEGFTSHSMQNR